ncbi:MAG: glycine C-acetyltransferase [SAR86 cluster bacterium]|uniref:2-amino-3-ketobutyrate coenzyme A ligase n=1 Tax=SAR86 cluster bacterium TaxID=2030880 RepID=A0A520MSZ0_9GAMM|nr:MAG: glycine C-acetyltransferase [SAR86 cluster bacterium]
MSKSFYNLIDNEVSQIVEDNLFKSERLIATPQQASIKLIDGKDVLNFCANDYLGLANNQLVKKAAAESLEDDGFGMASVRFICGTNNVHRELEKKLSEFLGYEDSILYVACFDANGGLFEPLFGKEDAIISDSLNHASIIDGIRLCKAERYRYQHSDMSSLEQCLQQAKENKARHIVIATDGVFSMDGTYAKLDQICELAEKYDALVMVDDCHATGFVGKNGKGTPEHFGVEGKVDILTGTLGKALGGASGGFICAKENVVQLLKQRSRPYLFSNALSPSIVKATLQALEIVENEPDRRARIKENTLYFREKMNELGFTLKGESHPITPVMLGDAEIAQKMSAALLEKGLYAVGFFYPVVPKGQARIRLQLTSEHTKNQLDKAIEIFEEVGKSLKVI